GWPESVEADHVLVGALVYREQFWIATTLRVASMLLLELKTALETLTKRITPTGPHATRRRGIVPVHAPGLPKVFVCVPPLA
ncbi:MAG TPA: hypothetical protein VJ732_08130, partial [Bryobacteraceae bacterium]|nr:hypothetical protein [Bryobacteraceae bacterium]